MEGLKHPRALPDLLWATRADAVRVTEDPRPGVAQALGLLLSGLARTRRFALAGRVPEREVGRVAFLIRAGARLIRAVAGELLADPGLYLLARRSARRQHSLPRGTAAPRSVIYIRAEPSLSWMGHRVGGAATHTAGVINGLRDNGVEPMVIAAERPDGIDGISFTDVSYRGVSRLAPALTYAEHSRDLLQATDGLQADFVYQRYALGSVVGLELAERLGVPLVLEFNGSEIWVERNWGSGRVRMAGTLEEIERRNLLDASLVVVVAAPLKDQVVAQGVCADRVLVNPNGVDTDRLEPYRARTAPEWRRALGLADAPTVGFIGTFGPWHGVTLLPEMISRLRDSVPDARWVLIGAGSLHRQVTDEIEARGLADRTSLPGIVPHDRALQLLAACDVCVSPHVPNSDGSPFFGSPTKLFEYMGLAKPIVASDLDQLGEVIESGRTGILCPPGDAGAAARAIAELLDDPERRARLAEAALARARTDYSWRAHARRTLDALTASN